ncbi:MAG: hypothetical protein ACM4D3_18705, partial [Candidatus Sericytochromatia bacterium]
MQPPLNLSVIALSVCVVASLSAEFILLKDALIDDAYIGLDYARNLGLHFHWGLVESAPSNTATSVLNVVVTGAVTAIVRDAVVACGIVYVACGLLSVLALRSVFRTLDMPGYGGVIAAILVMFNPVMMSTIGMESAMLVALLAVGLVYAVINRPVSFAVVSALLVLTRPDTILLAVPMAFFMKASRADWRKALVAFVMLVAGWYLMSWAYMGSVVPDTFLIKAAQRSWDGVTFASGVSFFLSRNTAMTMLALLVPAAGLLAFAVWAVSAITNRHFERKLLIFGYAVIGGLLIYVAYTVISVPPYHWYYVPTMAVLSVFMAAFICAARNRILHTIGVAAMAVIIVGILVTVAVRPDKSVPPFTTNWTSAQQYQALGRELRSLVGQQSVMLEGEAGTITYYCECETVNVFSDRGLMTRRITERSAMIPSPVRWLVDLNWHFRDWGEDPLA